MEESSPPPPPTTVRRNPHRRARNTPFVPESLSRFDAEAVATTLPPFSLDDAAPELAVPLPPLPSASPSPAKPSRPDTAGCSNLKVFLRIRPVEIKPQPGPRLRARNPNPRGRARVSPQKPARKRLTEVCLAVNGPESVTLTIPKSKLLDSRRGSKSEIYDGFSFVFPPESLQIDVYDKVMDPLVKDFMGGKSALLVAMGPTGSGKTHTMFGSNRDPGLVPLALKKIFSTGEKNSSQPRSFYLAMLEIYSVSGKGEKMIDLLSDGTELTLVQSTIKGLEEVPISDLEGAERLVARGMSKRSTAATDANSQSSRSQCIITIRRANDVFDTRNDMLFGNGSLVIADLAGAERDKKTGNMGSRLGESHFINNTSMVFGLCLRSLLEHQKNPKRPLEMHYKSSLLTRYLKEYLEGKKRMTLILTVKPGEDDYVDTSFVLRQAAPYMKIKFTATEEVNVPPVQKRSNVAVAQQGHKKRRKVSEETPVDSVEAIEVSEKEKLEVVQGTVDSIIPNNAASVGTTASNDVLDAELQKAKRNEVIMTQFARAFWKTLKLYKEKLLNSENEILSMREIIIERERRILVLEEELAKVIACQSQSEQVISCLDGNDMENTGSVSELTETTDDQKHFESLSYKNSSADSTKRGTPSSSSNSTTDSSSILLENSLLPNCEQATVLSIKVEHEDKHSENVIYEATEKVCLSFPAEPQCFRIGNPTENYCVDGNPLEMVRPDSNIFEGLVLSTDNEAQSSLQLVKAKASKAADTSPLMIEARRRNIEFSSQHPGSSSQIPGLSGSGFVEVFKEKLSSFEWSREKQFIDINPLEMVCPDSDNDEGEMLDLENKPKTCTKYETDASEIAEHSPSSAIASRRKGCDFVSACDSGEDFTKESGAEGDMSSEGSIEEPKHHILEQTAAEDALTKSISSLNLCQTIQEAEVEPQMINEMYDEDKSSNDIRKEGNCGSVIGLEHSVPSPDQILRETPFSKDDLLQMVFPDSDAEEEAMLSTEKTIEFSVRHIEEKAPYIERFSPLVTEASRQSSELVRQRNSSSGCYFSNGAQAEKTISFENSREEESDNTLEQEGAREDAASSTSLKSQEFFQNSQADKVITQLDIETGSPQQLKQDSSSSSEKLKLELENIESANCDKSRKETRQDPVGEISDLLVEPKKDPEEHHLTSSCHDGKSSIERRKENHPIKTLIEVIGKENHASPSKPFIARKPKRRLRPASSMLLKEFTSPDMGADIPKEGRGKTIADQTRSEGSMSLIQLLTMPIRERNV